jgi:hypothetical protein
MNKKNKFLKLVAGLLIYLPSLSCYQIVFEHPTFSKDQAKEIQSKLIHDPIACITKQFNPIQTISCTMMKRGLHVQADVEGFFASEECVKDFRDLPEDPLLYLSECSVDSCQLSRQYYEKAKVGRDFFDNFIASELVSKAGNKPVEYVNLGSGGLFEDARILSLAKQKGAGKLVIHLIDPLYVPYIHFLKINCMPTSCLIDRVERLNLSSEHYIPCAMSYSHSLFRVFTNYLTSLYGADNVTFHIYGNEDEYLNSIEHGDHDARRVIVLADASGVPVETPLVMGAFKKLAQHFNNNSIMAYLDPFYMFYFYPSTVTLPEGFEDVRTLDPHDYNDVETKLAQKKF